MSYIPLSHSTDRMRCWETILNGGRIGLANYNPSNWKEHETGEKKKHLLKSEGSSNGVEELVSDIVLVMPTVFIAPPNIWNGLYFLYGKSFSERALAEALGGKVKMAATGGSPTSETIMNWVKECLGSEVAFIESYGTTECGGEFRIKKNFFRRSLKTRRNIR
jgi:acyl-CoA synthetase (AMP-forming)/AMP-acid ligase II